METQYAQAKGELLMEAKVKTTSMTIKDLTPAGARIELNGRGEVTGRYKARHNETATLLVKPDGTYEFEVKGIETTDEGELVFVTGRGAGRQETPTSASFTAEASWQTPSKRLAWLNTTKTRSEGTYNLDTQESVYKVYAKK